jgi:hypothetical protein
MTDQTKAEANIDPPAAATWTWRPVSTKPDAPPRMGYVRSAPLGDGSVFIVFGGLDAIHYGYCDEKNGDPYFPGPYVVEGGDRASEADVEHVAMAIFRAWRLGVRGGWEACARELVIGDGLGLFEIDEGVSHWVIAKDAADALEVVKEHDKISESEREWGDDPPEVTRLTIAMALKKTFASDDGKEPLLVEAQRDPVRRYVACSEY